MKNRITQNQTRTDTGLRISRDINTVITAIFHMFKNAVETGGYKKMTKMEFVEMKTLMSRMNNTLNNIDGR